MTGALPAHGALDPTADHGTLDPTGAAESTGVVAVTAAALTDLDTQPVTAHAAVYTAVHGRLHGVLAHLDRG